MRTKASIAIVVAIIAISYFSERPIHFDLASPPLTPLSANLQPIDEQRSSIAVADSPTSDEYLLTSSSTMIVPRLIDQHRIASVMAPLIASPMIADVDNAFKGKSISQLTDHSVYHCRTDRAIYQRVHNVSDKDTMKSSTLSPFNRSIVSIWRPSFANMPLYVHSTVSSGPIVLINDSIDNLETTLCDVSATEPNPYVTGTHFNRHRSMLEYNISNKEFVDRIISDGWNGLCRSFRVSSDPELWLEIKPIAASATEPDITEDDRMMTQLGLDFEVQVVDHETTPTCGVPDLSLKDRRNDGVTIILPIEITYDTLNSFLGQFADEKEFSNNDNYSIRFNAVRISPYGTSLLLSADIVARAPGWFGATAKGVLYLAAKPHLNNVDQELQFVKIKLDTSSRSALVKLGFEVAELILINALEDFSFDLKPSLAAVERMAQAAFDELTGSIRGIQITSSVPKIHIDRIDVGPTQLRLVARVTGYLSIDVLTLPTEQPSVTDHTDTP